MVEPGKATTAVPRRPVARILRAAEARAWQDGHAFLDEARRDAQQLRDAARRAYAAEYAQGYEDGKAQGDADAARLVSETAVEVDRYLSGLEAEITNLALDVVRRVLGEFDASMLVAKAAAQAVTEIRRAKYLKVRVHPASVNRVRDELNAVLRESDLGMTVEIDADDTLATGACILSTDIAVIDASIEAQLNAIAAAISSKAEAAA
ncbi:MAG: HrpE/YscL family type III secretion apparatus protein [Mesorhizobium sp.]|uniref:type III secretion system stator protein SctL n=1 Tax=Mesorhizobium sp. TaxID=1871066 RepID=UPI000FE89DDD|nr:type III secretion system stator protein SctL [Mesorhizobium sp.]RWH84578.1 MAG: HrpE/YscL family type III secretion apparatus protein [Mesorhizobium sp.]RWH86967.1 MAG: HrpE/YscL family type III secretion apparatus protein [Mesorhizobium sp.]RWH93495.1 MAG: HrpE/YscL family type III secretion apparatus protein [Mesorhizobium sp.]RWI03048.1 MAG: HrpE/YscL family type III secretion apparatus protein [Mesorhizobium sp.]RWI05556.1 MAG: HrpE/YscL family type III secretion apparatus protein [Mes